MAMSSPSRASAGGAPGRAGNFVGDAERLVGRISTNRETRGDDANRPLVPAAGLPAVGAVGIGGSSAEYSAAFS